MSFPFTVPLNAKEIRSTTATQRIPLGTRGATADGRIFRYARNGATALTKGYLVQSAVPGLWCNATLSYLSTAVFNTTAAAYLGTSGVSSTWTYMPLVSTTGDTTLPIVTENYFAEGYMWVSRGNATGQMVTIKSHAAAATSGQDLKVYFKDDERLVDSCDTASFISMNKNEYDQVVIAPVTLTSIPRGVPNCDVVANYYCWLQTWGPCAVKGAAATSSFRCAYNSTATAGTVDGATASTSINCTTPSTSLGVFKVGEFMSVPIVTGTMVAADFLLVHLTMAP